MLVFVRFAFGKNWLNFLKRANSNSIEIASKSINDLLQHIELNEIFLDVGCGSGIFSLAARNKNMNVTSFDYDEFSVKATQSLKDKYYKNDKKWNVFQGSILDKEFLKKFINKFDIVYSWGVLHHTGEMLQALENISVIPKRGGFLIISIYNNQGYKSIYWKKIKKLYNTSFFLKILIILIHAPYFLFIVPLKKILFEQKFQINRGMNLWYDYLDWIGGYPFEVASVDQIVNFFKQRGFKPVFIQDINNRLGCNEYIFQNINAEHEN